MEGGGEGSGDLVTTAQASGILERTRLLSCGRDVGLTLQEHLVQVCTKSQRESTRRHEAGSPCGIPSFFLGAGTPLAHLGFEGQAGQQVG